MDDQPIEDEVVEVPVEPQPTLRSSAERKKEEDELIALGII